ncbi:hypothetical protein [Curtobacterium sp. L1-20]|uniref:hypothetical protein n=1 Tax=Curtobacterium sp. L1-20 TaxID=3138181 RepID=UPI003B522D0E
METQLQDAVRRAGRRAVRIALVGAVAGLALGVWLSLGERPLALFLICLGSAMVAAGLSAALSIMLSQRRMKRLVSAPITGLDADQRRDVRRAIESGAPVAPALESHTIEHARVLEVTLPLATAQVLVLYCGIAGSQVISLGSAETSWVRLVLIGVLVVTSVIAIVELRRGLARVRRYLDGAPAAVRE